MITALTTTEPTFELFSNEHLYPFIVVLLLYVFLSFIVYKKSFKLKRTIGIVLSVLTILIATTYTSVNFFVNLDNLDMFLSTGLPLWLCSLVAPLALIGFITLKDDWLSFAYLLSMSANIMACITPHLHNAFPHIDYFLFFGSHGMNLLLALYIAAFFQPKPTWKTFWIFVIMVHVYVGIIHFVNIELGSNYNYTVSKPSTGTLFDSFPEWPIYLVYAGLTGIVTSLIFFLTLGGGKKK